MTGAEAWLTGRRGQALALALVAVAGLMVWIGAVQPLLSWYSARADLLQERQAIAAHMSGLVATLPGLRQAAKARPDDAITASAVLGGDSDGVAGAMLQERVQALARTSGASLASVETLPAEAAGAWRRIGLRISLTASWPVLVALLRAVEQSKPEMLVDDLHVHSMLGGAEPAAAPVQTSFTLFAFRSAR